MTTTNDFPADFAAAQFDNGDDVVTGDYRKARGILAPFWDGEPAEVSIRRLRDGNYPTLLPNHPYWLEFDELLKEIDSAPEGTIWNDLQMDEDGER